LNDYSTCFLQAVEVPDDILRVKREIDAEFFGEDQNWGRVETIVSLCPTLNSYPLPLPFSTEMTNVVKSNRCTA
jgi:hypothetical protein